ncbi:MAG TPA: enoyl-CoA hydratase/isomerase family protein [Mycobacteriales bacterium]|nr:enoyl-CoA hydratase/isomerase family protein [Mycobacteriales bacterium]
MVLLVDRPSEGVVLLTLDLPDRRNAMTDELTAAWVAAVDGLRGDRSVRCVVVTGAGRAFCAGGDLGWLESGGASVDALRDKMLPFYRAWLSLRALDVPSIAAVNGPAVGAGAALALSCDLRYAGPAASLSVPFAHLGMHAGMATTYTLTEVAGVAVARDLLLTGRTVRAEEMLRLRLCSELLDDVVPGALERAAMVAAGAPVATRLHREALRDGGPVSLERALAWEAVAQPVTMTTADLQEGLRAKAEKRPARFTGA